MSRPAGRERYARPCPPAPGSAQSGLYSTSRTVSEVLGELFMKLIALFMPPAS
jgi:hypothetical protein